MQKHEILSAIREQKLIPVVRTKTYEQARAAIDVLANAGIGIFEITMSVPNAIALIEEMRTEDLLVGAGTVTSAKQAAECVSAGAKFIVGPAFDVETVSYCITNDILIMPGCLTPSEVLSAHKAGADCVKVFPCDALGGAKYLKTLKTLFPSIEFMPTGGVNLETIAEFFAAGAFAVGVGTDLINIDEIEAGNIEAVSNRAKAYLAKVNS